MHAIDFKTLRTACECYPKPEGFRPSYGTAGFRAEASQLESTLFRCGLLMALRAAQKTATTGIVVTASHNPVNDNGVKLVEPDGHMLAQAWEPHADILANAAGCDAVLEALKQICRLEGVSAGPSRVCIGHDTRPSCKALVAAAVAGVKAAGGSAEVLGLLTTPQLHWIVRRRNAALPHAEHDYFAALAAAFAALTKGTTRAAGPLYVDCANGVGAAKLQMLAQHAPQLELELRNTGDGPLNGDCGADAVQKGPAGVPAAPSGFEDVPLDARCASIDGDADRVVYFTRPDDRFALFDGDRIAVLAALLVKELVSDLPRRNPPVSVGVVQTAYANGSSSACLRGRLGLDVRLAKTGVKHLHHAAESFDVGIYFEANGHGTVLFAERFLESLEQCAAESAAAAALLHLAAMVNQAVGDALSGVLLVEAALRRRRWTLRDLASLYEDLPSCMLKVKVPDRSVFTTSNAETKVVTPAGLQQQIDRAVQAIPSGRSFVRPSGTEDVVRIYAEAESHEHAKELAAAVAALVTAAAAS